MKRLCFFILLIVLALPLSVVALINEVGVNPLRLEMAARPLGMGGAFTGLADDANAVLYNPGGLAWVRGIEVTLKDFENATAVQAYPTGYNSSLGLAVGTANITNIPVATGVVAGSSSSFLVFGYGAKMDSLPLLPRQDIYQHIGFGLTLKSLAGETLRRTGQADRTGTGWDMDLGALWKGSDWWTAGVSLQNILPAKTFGGGEIKWDNAVTEGIPASLNVGGAAKVIGGIGSPFFMDGRELNVGGELDLGSSNFLLRLGGEWIVDKTYAFRTGIMQQAKAGGTTTGLNLGFGYRTPDWGADIASYTQPQNNENRVFFSVQYLPKEWIILKKLDVSRPQLILENAIEKLSLADNLVTYDDRVEISGQVKQGVEVYVNDLRAFTADDNSFKVTVPLNIGKNLIIVEARYQGEKKTWTYKALRKVPVQISEERELNKELAAAKAPQEKELLQKEAKVVAEKKQKVEELVTLGIVEVAPGQEFRLDATLTRGELATWIAKASGFSLPRVDGDLYSDVKKDNPLAPYIKLVVDVGLLTPFADGTFRPEAPVSKEEGERLFKLLRKAQR